MAGLNVLLATSEYYGLVKSGGLADMTASLAKHLVQQGHKVIVVLPHYSWLIPHQTETVLESMKVDMPMGSIYCAIRGVNLEGVDIRLIEHHQFYSRSGLYDEKGAEYGDNPVRFGFFAMAALALCEELDFAPDIIHCNDWQTGMLPLYLLWKRSAESSALSRTKSLMTVHNALFQGKFSAYHRGFLGISDESFPWNPYEEFGYINMLKGAVHCADWVNAVSPNYAAELRTPEGGHGLHQSFSSKADRFTGILNGIDEEVWSPQTDKHIKSNYSISDRSGKRACTSDLLSSMGLPQSKGAAVIGIISRLTAQKGMDYLVPALYMMMEDNIKFIILGDGDKQYVDQLNRLQHLNPEKVVFYHGYNEALAHKIEAGSNLFLMPSLFEPCGLNQLYSLRYGTPPIVRAVGGLKDTVINFDYDLNGQSNGFVFHEPSPSAITNTVRWAADIWRNRTNHFGRLVTRAMSSNHSLQRCGDEYVDLYNKIINLKQ